MKKLFLAAFAFTLVASLGASRTYAQAAASAVPEDKTAPSYDMKAQALLDLDTQNKKIISLVEVLPQDKFNWRPAPDTRSFAEVFLHVAGERYQILALGGATPPDGFDPKTYEKSTTDKAKIVAELKKTGDFAQSTIGAMTNAEFAKLLPKLGPQANAGDVVYILVADCHEHMGQVVAYARENGIVPPWTIAAKKAAEEKTAQDKAAADKKSQ